MPRRFFPPILGEFPRSIDDGGLDCKLVTGEVARFRDRPSGRTERAAGQSHWITVDEENSAWIRFMEAKGFPWVKI